MLGLVSMQRSKSLSCFRTLAVILFQIFVKQMILVPDCGEKRSCRWPSAWENCKKVTNRSNSAQTGAEGVTEARHRLVICTFRLQTVMA